MILLLVEVDENWSVVEFFCQPFGVVSAQAIGMAVEAIHIDLDPAARMYSLMGSMTESDPRRSWGGHTYQAGLEHDDPFPPFFAQRIPKPETATHPASSLATLPQCSRSVAVTPLQFTVCPICAPLHSSSGASHPSLSQQSLVPSSSV